MATKLKNLRVTKVDFVDEGANPDADIDLRKRRDAPGQEEPEKGGFMRKLLTFIGKAAGIEEEEINNAVQEIEKGGAESFKEKFDKAQKGKISDEIWDLCYALQSSLTSIIMDEEVDSTSGAIAMQESVDEFNSVIKSCIDKWCDGKVASITKKAEDITEADIALMESAVERLNQTIEKAKKKPEDGKENKTAPDEGNTSPKGEEEMKIDKKKLTPGELAFLEDIEKRCGEEEPEENVTDGGAAEQGAEEGVEKKAGTLPTVDVQNATAELILPEAEEDVYKGLHPAVKAELESLKKFREEAEDRELMEIAKKYEITGKKAEDLVPMFKSLRKAGGTAYTDMIAVLDQTVEMVQKSGAFTEIGKSGNGATAGGAWAEADAKAVELMKSKDGMTKAQALDEVLAGDPELAERCEKEE